MTVFMGACSVTSCPFNLGDGRVTCDWLRNGRGRCHHPQYREAWQAAYELEQAQEADPILTATATARTLVAGCEKMQDAPARPSSLAARVAAASRPMDAARARRILGEV